MYKHVNGDSTKDRISRKRKASTRTQFVVKHLETDLEKCLYDYVVDPAASQPSEETSWAFPLMEEELSLGPFWS